MTRSSKLVLLTLLAGLLSLVPVSAVTAASSCTGIAREHCEQMAAANDAALFRITEIASPTHVSSEEQRYLDVNTTWIPAVASPVMTMEQQKFLEMNTIMPVAAPASYMEQLPPSPGQPV